MRKEEENKMNIYGQQIWHTDVNIIGSRGSLIKLQEALGEALEKGESSTEVRASDGLIYKINVIDKGNDQWLDEEWEDIELPYQNEMAKEDTDIIKQLKGKK